MDNIPVVLYVDDEAAFAKLCQNRLDARCGNEVVRVMAAPSAEVAETLLVASLSGGGEIKIVVMDGDLLNNRTLNTEGLVIEMRELGFTGPIIAGSSREEYNTALMKAGCSHRPPPEETLQKHVIPGLIAEILGLKPKQ